MLLPHNKKSAVFWIVVISTLIRSVVAWCTNLGNDEVYYFTYAVQPDLNHFDHPPLVGIFIRVFTANLHFYNEFLMRLPAILGAAINTWLIARCGKMIRNVQAGVIAALLYNTSIYTSIISGVFILPDSVQIVSWLAALFCMLQSIRSQSAQKQNRYLVWIGIWIGLAVMSKVHGVFLWAGFLAFIVFNKPTWLKKPSLYLSLIITAVLISPILIWNINNDFITWHFHSERVQPNGMGVNAKSFLRTTIGQMLYCNPFQFSIYVLLLYAIVKRRLYVQRMDVQLLLWCSLPLIVCTTASSLFRDTLPHWSGPGYIGLMLLSAAFVDQSFASARSKIPQRLVTTSAGLILLVVLAGLPIIHYYPGTFGKKSALQVGSDDPTLDLYGWDQLLPAFKKIRDQDMQQNSMSADAPLVVNRWFPGGHLYYYLAYPLRMNLVGLGELNDLHKFKWLNEKYDRILPGTHAYFVSPSNNFTDPAKIYSGQFQSIEKAATIVQKRNNQVARKWYVYRLKNAIAGRDIPAPPTVDKANSILIFSKTAGFRHSSIEAGITAIKAECARRDWDVHATENAALINSTYLPHFKVVVFLSTTGEILTTTQKQAFEMYMKNGGGYAGIHSASDTEHHWDWYGQMLGTRFRDHTFFPVHTPHAELITEAPDHPSTSGLPARWQKEDEWYNFEENVRGKAGFQVLLSLNESSYPSIWRKMDGDHPISWTHAAGKGRMFYTALGHHASTFTDPDAMRHIIGGIQWAGKLD
ncbi:ThuA domain-containing protein [Dyadobacter crusticola]|uniref:ThuA domain-containing protein n=1 Tax=Dyadobacter crusticola TaxID=292407 RepID=UPI00068B3E90|nr:ThuA domain-containing protein [Dyadobacter crusticola]